MHRVPVVDAEPWSVGTVYCLGKNYRAHAVEMGQATPKPPVIFLKPATTLVPLSEPVAIPTDRGPVHHEIELVIGVRWLAGRVPADVTPDDAESAIATLAVGLDLTLRDVQSAAKSAGEPWAASKGFTGSAPVSALRARGHLPWSDLSLSLSVNGAPRQSAPLSDMTLSPAATVAAVARAFPLADGDLIFTGTPAGVGPLSPGDTLDVRLDPIIAERTRVG